MVEFDPKRTQGSPALSLVCDFLIGQSARGPHTSGAHRWTHADFTARTCLGTSTCSNFHGRCFSSWPPALALPAFSQDAGQIERKPSRRSSLSGRTRRTRDETIPTRPFFGDTHLHTSYSMDGGAAGARLGPKEAYRFARGRGAHRFERSAGQALATARFLVVADHSDGLGFFPLLFSGDPKTLAYPQARKWYDMIQEGKGVEAALDLYFNLGKGTIEKGLLPVPGTPAYQDAWRKTIDAAEEANEPGRFTAFIGFEWTSGTGGNNLHRNVIFRDGGTRAGKVEPFTAQPPFGSDNPRDLWKYMADYEAKTGGRALAIAHNGNGSNGRMFPIIESFTGKKIDRAYAENRRRWEPLYEVTQMKGTSEAHPFLSPNDEFAAFEIWDKGNLDVSAAKKPEMLEFEYARSAFKNGLKMETELGINPYKFGLVGSTDSHTALAAVEEDNFFGKTSGSEPSPTRAEHPFIQNPDTGITVMGWETAASGYAAVWATENTRESIWDAMERRETYATTGTRMVVRFFGGWDFEARDAQDRQPATSATPRAYRWAATSRRRRAARPRFPGRRAQGSDGRKPRSNSGHQGLAGLQGRDS